MNKNTINRICLVFAYTLLLHFAAYSGMIFDEKNYVLRRNIVMLCIVVYLLVTNNKLPQLFSNKYHILWYLFSGIVAIAVFPLNIMNGIKLLCVPIVYFIIMQYDKNLLYHVSFAMVINGAWILLQSLQLKGLSIGIYYSGVFSNTNTFGASMACFFVGACCIFLYAREVRTKVLTMGLASVSFFFQLISFCRTALLTSVIIFSVFFLIVSNTSKNKVRLILVYVICLVITLGAFVFKGSEIIEYILIHVYKWGSASDSISSSRVDMWMSVFRNPTVLGTNIKFHPHNNFVFVL